MLIFGSTQVLREEILDGFSQMKEGAVSEVRLRDLVAES